MIYIILGTKAQLIKMAPVMKALEAAGLPYRFIATGQHRETMTDILENFGLRCPDYQLYSGKDITSVLTMFVWATGILWQSLRRKNELFGPNPKGIVLIHGDTFSTLLGALMGRLLGLKVGHVESGLRSFNLFHPFPEEIIRLITFRLSHLLFCPGSWAIANVANQAAEKVNTGSNTLADALQLALSSKYTRAVALPTKPFAIVTVHRFENIFSRAALERVVAIVERVARHRQLLFILHPPTEKKLREFGLYERLCALSNLDLRQRVDYFRFIQLVSEADFVISDGGSNQEECYYLGKPLLLLRKATERHEGLGENCVLSDYDLEVIDNFVAGWAEQQRSSCFPEKSASEIIVAWCRRFL